MFKICCASLFLIAITFIKVSACTNFLLTRGATQDGSTMITYSADSHVLYGELYHWACRYLACRNDDGYL